jgi:hypothetical protein
VATLVMTVAPVARAQLPSFSPTTRFTVFVFCLGKPAPARRLPRVKEATGFPFPCYVLFIPKVLVIL